MPPETEAAIATKGDRAKIAASDYVFPEWKKCPITSPAQATSAAKLIAKVKKPDGSSLTDGEIAAAKSRAKRIMNRKGYALPKSWQGDKITKKSGKEAITLSDDEVSSAFQAALRNDDDPDGDGDNDRDPDADYWWRGPHCWASAIIHDGDTLTGVYSWDGDSVDDDGLYQRTFTLDANGTVVLNDDIKRVVRQITYVDYVEQPDDEPAMDSHRVPTISLTESTTITEAFTEWGPLRESDVTKGKVRGTAIKPGFNKSGQRYYPKETLAASVSLLIGKKMYIDHPGRMDEKNRPERSVMEMAALVDNAWIDTDGSIQYEATVIDPLVDAKLTMMRERGALGAFGTSINYQGTGKENAVVEGRKTTLISSILDYNSLDFVTEAGAGGTVAALESDAEQTATTAKETVVNEEQVKAMIAGLEAKLEAADKAAQEARTEAATERKERRVAEAKAEIRSLLAESVLPAASHAHVLDAFDGAENTDGVAEAITAHIAYLTGLGVKMRGADGRESDVPARTTSPARRRGVVIGMGGTQTKEHDEPAAKEAPKMESATNWLFGDATKQKQFETFLR